MPWSTVPALTLRRSRVLVLRLILGLVVILTLRGALAVAAPTTPAAPAPTTPASASAALPLTALALGRAPGVGWCLPGPKLVAALALGRNFIVLACEIRGCVRHRG